MHTVAILAMDGVVAFDLSTPIEVFGRTYLPDGQAAYRVRVCGSTKEVNTDTFTLRVHWGLDRLVEADTIIVPGLASSTLPIPDDVFNALQYASARGTRIASICSGAFILAAAGLLDGLRATTHWIAARELARQYPKVEVDANVLFVDNGQILTSAGAVAGLDLCLYMIRRDYGSAVAADAARISVMPLERDGGQAQFIQSSGSPVMSDLDRQQLSATNSNTSSASVPRPIGEHSEEQRRTKMDIESFSPQQLAVDASL